MDAYELLKLLKKFRKIKTKFGELTPIDLLNMDLDRLKEIYIEVKSRNCIDDPLLSEIDYNSEDMELYNLVKTILEFRIKEIKEKEALSRMKEERKLIEKILYEKKLEILKTLPPEVLEKVYRGEITIDEAIKQYMSQSKK